MKKVLMLLGCLLFSSQAYSAASEYPSYFVDKVSFCDITKRLIGIAFYQAGREDYSEDEKNKYLDQAYKIANVYTALCKP